MDSYFQLSVVKYLWRMNVWCCFINFYFSYYQLTKFHQFYEYRKTRLNRSYVKFVLEIYYISYYRLKEAEDTAILSYEFEVQTRISLKD